MLSPCGRRWACGDSERKRWRHASRQRCDTGTGTGVGTDGSLHSPKEELDDHGVDRSGDKSDGVGTDGSLVNPEKEVAERPGTDPERTDRDEHTK